jgi:hypothetical protein
MVKYKGIDDKLPKPQTDVHDLPMPYLTNRVAIEQGAEATTTTSPRSVLLVALA